MPPINFKSEELSLCVPLLKPLMQATWLLLKHFFDSKRSVNLCDDRTEYTMGSFDLPTQCSGCNT